MKISKFNPLKFLPWDINPTYGGTLFFAVAWLMWISVCIMIITSTPVRLIHMVGFGIGFACLSAFWCLMSERIYGQLWVHFVGTNVDFKNEERLKNALDWCRENHKFWNQYDNRLLSHNGYSYTIRFKYRNKALMAKLAVL